ncbi:MAG TPA: multidrug effflux MFS transporter [Propionibacteriaceae bacterium]
MPAASTPAPRKRTIVALGLMSTFGPLSLDLYLPALPELADELQATTSAAQLSITTCLVGLAVGQLIAGPLSDRFGRRRPLVVGLVAYLLASLACAFAPSIGVLLVLRLVQGLAGAAGLVIARAVARDLYEGKLLLVFFSRLILISGLAPVVAPVLGGQLSRIMSWRGIFGVLAGFGLVLLLIGVFGLRETLPPERRTTGGLPATLRGFSVLIKDRLFVGSALSAGLAGASMFAYIAGATFVLQRIYGLSPQGFSLVFGANSLGIMAASQIGSRLARRSSALRVLALGLLVNLVGAVGLLVSVLLGLDLPFLIGSLFVMVSALGLVFPTATTLAMSDYPDQAGAASSLLGLGQFTAGAVAAPLVGIAGEDTAVPLGVVAFTASACASVVFATLVYPAVRRRRVLASSSPPDVPPSPV